jgi:hypothetical protein
MFGLSLEWQWNEGLGNKFELASGTLAGPGFIVRLMTRFRIL